MTCRLKPGSLTADGGVVDSYDNVQDAGPCFVPADLGVSSLAVERRRIALFNGAGWRSLRDAARWPGIPPTRGARCITRSDH